MASPRSERLAITPCSVRSLSLTPLSDETIWRRLREAGFDEDSIKRRDKAALIAFIAKLEAELFEHQHHMGLLILERKDLASKYEQMKVSAEMAETKHNCDQAAHSSSLAEARKREESLKKALGVEKECISSLERALHEMRAESAETKVAAQSKLAEARSMVENAQEKFTEADAKLLAAESLQAEATRYHHVADRKLQEVEGREDDLRRRVVSFKSECDAKEREIVLERQTLSERQKIQQMEQRRILDGQASLNQREDYISSRLQELDRLEKELGTSKMNIENQFKVLREEKSNLDTDMASLSVREKVLIEREGLLNKKEQELHMLQEQCASKISEEVKKGTADQEAALKAWKSNLEADLEMMRKSVEDEIETKRRALELRELDIVQREDLLHDRDHDIEAQSRILEEKEKDVEEKIKYLDKKEKSLGGAEKELELKESLLQKEYENINKMKLDIQKSLDSLEDKKNEVDLAKEKLDAIRGEINELSILEMKLKEEIDSVRAQKYEFMAEADRLKAEKAKFESEWESIDEKREELRKEEEHVAEEKLAISKFMKDEHESLKCERDILQEQYKQKIESIRCDKEKLMNEMLQERSDWFNKMQQERADFLLDIEVQRRELQDSIDKRQEELESRLREREKVFEQEKKNELQYVSCLRETAVQEMENVTLEMKRLDRERTEINLERDKRNKEWEELNSSIDELKVQRDKLKRQRELLHADREDILAQMDRLKELENLKIVSDDIAVAKMERSTPRLSRSRISAKKRSNRQSLQRRDILDSHRTTTGITGNSNGINSPMQNMHNASASSSARLSVIKRFAELVFKRSPGNPKLKNERHMVSEDKDPKFKFIGQLDLSGCYEGKKYTDDHDVDEIFTEKQLVREAVEEPRVILEVLAVSEDVKETNDLEPEMKEAVYQAGRKRRVEETTENPTEALVEDRQNNKKRKHELDTNANSSKRAVIHRTILGLPDVLEDKHATSSPTQAVEETGVVVVDKIIKISEVATTTYNCADREIIDCLQNPDAE